jgi:hypothetical protein
MPANPLFEVPADMTSGVVRAKYGHFLPGDEFRWPIKARPGDNPPLLLIPKNKEATALLEKTAIMKLDRIAGMRDTDDERLLGLRQVERAAAERLLGRIQAARDSGVEYHLQLVDEEAKAVEVLPPEDRVPVVMDHGTPVDPAIPPEDRVPSDVPKFPIRQVGETQDWETFKKDGMKLGKEEIKAWAMRSGVEYAEDTAEKKGDTKETILEGIFKKGLGRTSDSM